MSYNPNKAISANSYGINVFYTDTFKSDSISYAEDSPLKTLQIGGNQHKDISYQHITDPLEQPEFHKLYNEAMYGLKTYTEEEVRQMSYVRKMEILERFDQAQHRLNLWKQELVHNKIGSFLTTIFHKSDFAKGMAHYPKSINPWDKCTITFKQLGIRKEQIINKLIEFQLLPNYAV